MSLTGECFDKVFGLSRTTDDCFGTPPSGYDESASGLWLDEVPGLNLTRIFGSVPNTAAGWDLMEKAREDGVRRFTNETIKFIKSGAKSKRGASKSLVASDKASKAVNLSRTFHGVEVVFANHVGGTATFTRIGGAFKFTGSVIVDVYDDETQVPIYSRTITATNNQRAWTDIDPITVDLGTRTGDNKRLWFVFQPTTGQQALDVKVASCSCSGKPKWNPYAPYYESGKIMDGQAWTQWMMVGGTYGDDIAAREDWTSGANETQGLMFDVSFSCDARTALCTGTPDYDQDELQATFAYGSRFAAALYLVEFITGSTRVNRENIVNGDAMELARVSYQKEMMERAEYLGGQLSEPENVNRYSDCFTCKDELSLGVTTIRR